MDATKLTQEQQNAVNLYKKAIEELKAANVVIVYRQDGKGFALNGNEIYELKSVEHLDLEERDEYTLPLDELEVVPMPQAIDIKSSDAEIAIHKGY